MMQLQQEHKVWVDREYPNQPDHIPAAGMIEEAGELMHAILKLEQERRWGKDPRYSRLKDDLYDAIGDCGIYVCSYCNATGREFKLVSGDAYAFIGSSSLVSAARLIRFASDMFLVSYIDETLAAYMATLDCIARGYGFNLATCIRDVWSRVKERKRLDAKPKIVCLIGSCRFREVFMEANYRETMAGNIVLSVGFAPTEGQRVVTAEQKLKLDALHLRKIAMADEVLVIDPTVLICDICRKPCRIFTVLSDETECCRSKRHHASTYIGDSTRAELKHAMSLGKPIRYWSKSCES